MHLRYTNTAILVVIAILTLSGVYGIFFTLNGWMFDVHRIAAWALVALIPWKVGISWRSLRRGLRPRFDRGVMIAVSVGLGLATLAVLAFGLLWAWRIGPQVLWLEQTTISWHWVIALALIPPFTLHVWRRWPKPRAADFTARRNALRSLAVLGIGLVGWGAAEWISAAREAPNAPRQFSGSRGGGSFAGNAFPITGEWATPIDPATWQLTVHGAVTASRVLSYAEVLALPARRITATIDCTTGWYSRQEWRGVSLTELITWLGPHAGAAWVRLKSATGYAATFGLDEAQDVVLATHVGASPLDHVHGFPLRAVVPSRRGWYWVKWLDDVEVLVTPHFDLPGIL